MCNNLKIERNTVMKKTIFTLVCLMIMSTVNGFAKTVVVYNTHAPHKETVVVHKVKTLDKEEARKKKAAIKKHQKEVQKNHKKACKAHKKHNKKTCDCKKCEKWRKYHAKKGHRK